MIPSDGSAPSPLIDALNAAIDGAIARYHADLETACETAVQSGVYGVRVTWEGTTYTIEVTLDVPYGVMHVHQG